MQTLIEDLLDVAKIEAGAFVVRTSLDDLGPILEEARALFADQAERRSVTLAVLANGAGARVRVDRDRILQALANLLDNALRVTPEGGTVEVGLQEDADQVTITVSDTGPGIHDSVRERLFQRFTQSKSQRGGGAGLGLAIVRGVAEAHGGGVAVRTQLGGGSTFEIRIPRA
jgi:signal transduction histidine kinase